MVQQSDGVPRARRTSRSGMTLVETIVALCILSMCIGGICALIVSARELSDRARSHYTAVNIAKNRLERASALGFDQLPDFHEADVVVDHSGNPAAYGHYRRSTTVLEAGTNLRELVVAVEIRNRLSTDFDGEIETVSSYHADYLEPDGG